MAGKDKPKVTGLSFNLFAIFGILIILPFSIAYITSISAVNLDDERFSLTEGSSTEYKYPASQGFAPPNQRMALEWLDIGTNLTDSYIQASNGYSTFDETDEYNCMWLIEQYAIDDPNRPTARDTCSISHSSLWDSTKYTDNTGTTWHTFGQTHSWLSNSGVASSNYIGYSGESFSFVLHNSYFSNIEGGDLGSLKIRMVDFNTAYNVLSAPKENLSYDYSIKFVYGDNNFIHPNNIDNYSTIEFNDFDFDGINTICTGIDFTFIFNQINQNKCHIGMDLNFVFTSFEILELDDWLTLNGGNYSKVSAIITMDNFESEGQPNDFIGETLLPFAGDRTFSLKADVQYSNPQVVNLTLKGGTLVLGIALFWLAIASTPYYDPIKNIFKGAQ